MTCDEFTGRSIGRSVGRWVGRSVGPMHQQWSQLGSCTLPFVLTGLCELSASFHLGRLGTLLSGSHT